MSITLLLLLITITFAVGLKSHGAFSFVMGGLAGLAAYSVPAILGLVYPYHIRGSSTLVGLVPASDALVYVTMTAWAAVLVGIIPRARRSFPLMPSAREERYLERSSKALLLLSLAGLTFFMFTDGLLFFLEAREAQSQSIARLMWRWAPAIGLVTALHLRDYKSMLLFVICLLAIFLSGDRTIAVISLMACILTQGRDARSFMGLLRPRILLTVCALVTIAFFGKPIYLSAKDGTLDALLASISGEGLMRILVAYEPFTVANTLEIVVERNFTMPVATLLQGLLGQMLIIPSAFGIDPNSFNSTFTDNYVGDLSYGISGNYWAHAYAIGGYSAICVFGILYALLLRLADYGSKRFSGVVRGGWIIFGALVAVYAHRNGLDNLASFMRQVALMTIVTMILVHVLPLRTRSRVAQHRQRHGGWNTP